MTNFNPNPTDPNRVRTSRDVVQDDRAIREQNIAIREQNRAIRENDSAATGLMLGVLLLGLAALGFGTYFLTQRPAPAPTRTIIERDRTTTVPTTQPSPPNVNVTVPNPAPPNVNIVVPDSTTNTTPPNTAPFNTAPSNTAPSSTDSSGTAPSTTSPTGSTVAPSGSGSQTAPANP